MLNKEITNEKIIISETASSEDEKKEEKKKDFIVRRRKYQSTYGNKLKYCTICDKEIKQFSWQNHLKSKTHLLKKEIYQLKIIKT